LTSDHRAGRFDWLVILAVNRAAVKDGEELITKVADLPIGSIALVTVDRDGKQLDLKVPVADRAVVWKDEPQIAADREESAPPSAKSTQPAKFGITIMRLTEKERKDLQIEDKTGVKVVSVDPGSFAEDIGMAQGDAILSINRKAVSSTEDVTKALGND
jgi:serine protease Do